MSTLSDLKNLEQMLSNARHLAWNIKQARHTEAHQAATTFEVGETDKNLTAAVEQYEAICAAYKQASREVDLEEAHQRLLRGRQRTQLVNRTRANNERARAERIADKEGVIG